MGRQGTAEQRFIRPSQDAVGSATLKCQLSQFYNLQGTKTVCGQRRTETVDRLDAFGICVFVCLNANEMVSDSTDGSNVEGRSEGHPDVRYDPQTSPQEPFDLMSADELLLCLL